MSLPPRNVNRCILRPSPLRADRIQAFSFEPGEDDDVFIFGYDYESGSHPLFDDSSVPVIDVVGGQEDEILESAISASGVVGKDARTPKQLPTNDQQSEEKLGKNAGIR